MSKIFHYDSLFKTEINLYILYNFFLSKFSKKLNLWIDIEYYVLYIFFKFIFLLFLNNKFVN